MLSPFHGFLARVKSWDLSMDNQKPVRKYGISKLKLWVPNPTDGVTKVLSCRNSNSLEPGFGLDCVGLVSVPLITVGSTHEIIVCCLSASFFYSRAFLCVFFFCCLSLCSEEGVPILRPFPSHHCFFPAPLCGPANLSLNKKGAQSVGSLAVRAGDGNGTGEKVERNTKIR